MTNSVAHDRAAGADVGSNDGNVGGTGEGVGSRVGVAVVGVNCVG